MRLVTQYLCENNGISYQLSDDKKPVSKKCYRCGGQYVSRHILSDSEVKALTGKATEELKLPDLIALSANDSPCGPIPQRPTQNSIGRN